MLLALAAATASPICRDVPIPRMIADYSQMLKHQDSERIAALYGADGVIDNPGAQPIIGEKAILAFLSGFHGAVVDSSTLTIEKVLSSGDDWQVTGRFHQTGTTPAGKHYDVQGSFDSLWTCTSSGWGLRRMATGK